MMTMARRRGCRTSSAPQTARLAINADSRFESPAGLAGAKDRGGSASDGRPAPLIAADVDKDPDQPGLFPCRTGWNRSQGFRGSQEGLLHQIVRVVGARSEPPRKTVEAILVRLEQTRPAVRRDGRALHRRAERRPQNFPSYPHRLVRTAAGDARKSIKLLAIAGWVRKRRGCRPRTPSLAGRPTGSGPTKSIPVYGKQLADLLKANLGFAAGHDVADPFASVDSAALRQDTIGDPQLLKHFRRQVVAADAGGVSDRLRIQKCSPQRIDRADVWLRRTASNGHANR